MNQNPDVVVDISCGGNGKSDLEIKRVESVITYLKEKGIPENRIFTNVITTDANSDNAQYTLLNKQSRLTAFNNKIANNPLTDKDKPNTGNLLKGNYTIQVGAFSRKIEKNDKFFRKLGGKVKIYFAADNLYHYTYGKYTYMAEAEQNVEILHKLGYKDAFARDINWYKAEVK
jgi:hypothetical protein